MAPEYSAIGYLVIPFLIILTIIIVGSIALLIDRIRGKS